MLMLMLSHLEAGQCGEDPIYSSSRWPDEHNATDRSLGPPMKL